MEDAANTIGTENLRRGVTSRSLASRFASGKLQVRKIIRNYFQGVVFKESEVGDYRSVIFHIICDTPRTAKLVN